MNPWLSYTGDYEKQYYDIRLHSGLVAHSCWPNAGNFYPMAGQYKGREFQGIEVEKFRVSENQEF